MTAGRRPTIRLGYVLELVATAAICFAVVRSDLSWRRLNLGTVYSYAWVRMIGGSILSGLALSGGVGLVVETFRGRRPATWGLGRWVWSIAGLFILFNAAVALARMAILRLTGVRPWEAGMGWKASFERATVHQFFGGFGWTIGAVCATAMLARSPRDSEPDAREWTGRLFASLAVALNIAEPLLREAGW